MRTYVAGTVCAVLLGVASLAQAGQLLSPPYSVNTRGSNVGTKAACVIRNTGNEPATVSVSLITNNNDAVGIFDKHVLDNLGILVLHPIRFAPLR